jgi:hypothetical protein
MNYLHLTFNPLHKNLSVSLAILELSENQRSPIHLQFVAFLDNIDPEHPVRLLLLQVANILGDLNDLNLRHLHATPTTIHQHPKGPSAYKLLEFH